MKRRLTIARALINEPELLLLDEPTTGLDPQARHVLWDRLYRLKQQGVTLVLTTHYMDEAEQLCDRLVMMDQAKIVAEGSPRQLIDQHSSARSSSSASPTGTSDQRQARGLGERVEVLPDRILRGHRQRRRDGERGPRARHRGGERPRPTQHARGRVPDADRPDARRLMATVAVTSSSFERALSVTEWHARSYRRTWRATITTAFLNPIFFLLSVGILLGKLIDDDQAALGGLSYVEFVAPGLLAATAMQMGANDAMWPVMAGIKWLADVPRGGGDSGARP